MGSLTIDCECRVELVDWFIVGNCELTDEEKIEAICRFIRYYCFSSDSSVDFEPGAVRLCGELVVDCKNMIDRCITESIVRVSSRFSELVIETEDGGEYFIRRKYIDRYMECTIESIMEEMNSTIVSPDRFEVAAQSYDWSGTRFIHEVPIYYFPIRKRRRFLTGRKYYSVSFNALKKQR